VGAQHDYAVGISGSGIVAHTEKTGFKDTMAFGVSTLLQFIWGGLP
jgi:hypothetical protein